MRARHRRLVAGLVCATLALGAAACGGGGGGGGDTGSRDTPRGGPTTADVAAATRSIEAARDCPGLYEAGGALVKRLDERAADARDPAFEDALRDADAAIGRKLRSLRCTRSGHVCEEMAKRAGIERARLEC